MLSVKPALTALTEPAVSDFFQLSHKAKMNSLWQEEARLDLIRRLDNLKPDALGKWGRMNAPQMLAHLNNSFGMAKGELPVKSKKLPIRFWPIKKLIIYWLPFPKGSPTAPELIERKPGNWELEKNNFRAHMNTVTAASFASHHPVFGTMTPKDWGVLGYRHIDHHFRQFGV